MVFFLFKQSISVFLSDSLLEKMPYLASVDVAKK